MNSNYFFWFQFQRYLPPFLLLLLFFFFFFFPFPQCQKQRLKVYIFCKLWLLFYYSVNRIAILSESVMLFSPIFFFNCVKENCCWLLFLTGPVGVHSSTPTRVQPLPDKFQTRILTATDLLSHILCYPLSYFLLYCYFS